MSEMHDELCERAVKWLKSKGCMAYASELTCWGTQERPDAIGWKSDHSILIEAKTSRSDFHADKKKPFRANNEKGVGDFRYYLTNKGVLKTTDLPKGWGLLEIRGSKIYTIKKSDRFDKFEGGEIGMLASLVRRSSEFGMNRKHRELIEIRKEYSNLLWQNKCLREQLAKETPNETN